MASKTKLFGIGLPVIVLASASYFAFFTKAGQKMLGIKPAMPNYSLVSKGREFKGWVWDKLSWRWKPEWATIQEPGFYGLGKNEGWEFGINKNEGWAPGINKNEEWAFSIW